MPPQRDTRITSTEQYSNVGPMAIRRKYQIVLATTDPKQQEARTGRHAISMLKKIVIALCDRKSFVKASVAAACCAVR